MANQTEKQVEKKATTSKQPVASYTVDEFAAAPGSLGVNSPDIIRAAFSIAGKESATIEEAKKIVKEFKTKEVK